MWYNFLYEHYIMYDSSWNASESRYNGERPSDGELCPRDSLWDYLWDNALLVTYIVTVTRGAFVVTNFHFATARSVAEGRGLPLSLPHGFLLGFAWATSKQRRLRLCG